MNGSTNVFDPWISYTFGIPATLGLISGPIADQMFYRLSRDLKLSSPCPSGEALLRQVRRHAELTNELINAYRGKSDTSFQQAAAALNQSIKTLLELNRTARISEVISHMIHQSLPLISFVNQNAGHDSIGSKT